MPVDNFVQTFQLESSRLRGRIVRIGSVLEDIIKAHEYPEPIAHLVGEIIILAAALSSMFKYEGIFTLQAQGNGPISMLVADVTSDGMVRGSAAFDRERFEKSYEQLSALETKEGSSNHLAQYLGKGYIAFTVDQPDKADRYQGIVELKGFSLVDCVQHYFRQSEQIGTGIKMAVGIRNDVWRGEAIMLQHMPEDEKNPQAGTGNIHEDDWRRAMVLLDSCTDDELLSTELDTDDLLFRLFHEEGIMVYERKILYKGCRCSRERVEIILKSFLKDDLEYMSDDGVIVLTCEFCGSHYKFDLSSIERTDNNGDI